MRTLFFTLFLFIKCVIGLFNNFSFLSGSMDIIAINNNGTLKCSPFHIRFGVFKIINPQKSLINIFVNDILTPIEMKLTKEGDVFFPNSLNKFTPSNEILQSFNLKQGKNKIAFEIKSSFFQKIRTLTSFIYLWDSNSKLVISDVDGTITRSDILGVVLPFFGIDWSQKNIVKLFKDIVDYGYKIIYLTARPIGESFSTRNFLNSLKQGPK